MESDNCSPNLTPVATDNCTSAIKTQYKIVHANTDAFELGLYYQAWRIMDARYKAASSLPDNPIAIRSLTLLEPATRGAFQVVKYDERRVGVTDQQLFAATGTDGELTRERWGFWSSLATQP
jgi:hypothetical protein